MYIYICIHLYLSLFLLFRSYIPMVIVLIIIVVIIQIYTCVYIYIPYATYPPSRNQATSEGAPLTTLLEMGFSTCFSICFGSSPFPVTVRIVEAGIFHKTSNDACGHETVDLADILHHLLYMKSYETWDILNINWLAGFLPSMVLLGKEDTWTSQQFLQVAVAFLIEEWPWPFLEAMGSFE